MSRVGYDAATMLEARRLRDAGFSLAKIQGQLVKVHGVRPSKETLRMWTSLAPDIEAERVRRSEARRRAGRWKFRLSGATRTPEYEEAFILTLDREGLAATSIAKVCRVVFPESTWHRQSVRDLVLAHRLTTETP